MPAVRIAIVGAGAIGGFLAARLAASGCRVTLVARGAQLTALSQGGLTLIERDGRRATHRIPVVARLAAAGPQDYVMLAVKAHQVEPLAADLSSLPPDTTIVPVQNGIPWWYFQRHGGPHEARTVRAVDPHGQLAATVDPARIVGCVVYPAGELVAPGVVRHVQGERFPLGELDGAPTARVQALSEAMAASGLKSPVLDDIRAEIWLKLWGNLAFNPLSALTGATLDRICAEPRTRALAAAMMAEAEGVASRLGITFRVSIERRIEGAARIGRHKTSMLMDVEAGRATEIDAVLGSVIELARLTDTPVPRLEAVYACMALLEASARAGDPAGAAPRVAELISSLCAAGA
jgi:2-dehydropantoate 2-reductase